MKNFYDENFEKLFFMKILINFMMKFLIFFYHKIIDFLLRFFVKNG